MMGIVDETYDNQREIVNLLIEMMKKEDISFTFMLEKIDTMVQKFEDFDSTYKTTIILWQKISHRIMCFGSRQIIRKYYSRG